MTSSHTCTSLPTLPEVCLHIIYHHLTVDDLSCLGQVSKSVYVDLQHHLCWKHINDLHTVSRPDRSLLQAAQSRRRHLCNVTLLSIDHTITEMKQSAVTDIGKFPRLRQLQLYERDTADDVVQSLLSLPNLMSSLTHLTWSMFGDFHISATQQFLTQFHCLTYLNIAHIKYVQPQDEQVDFAFLLCIPTLQVVEFHTMFTDHYIPLHILAQMPQLRKVLRGKSLNMDWSDMWLEEVRELVQLRASSPIRHVQWALEKMILILVEGDTVGSLTHALAPFTRLLRLSIVFDGQCSPAEFMRDINSALPLPITHISLEGYERVKDVEQAVLCGWINSTTLLPSLQHVRLGPSFRWYDSQRPTDTKHDHDMDEAASHQQPQPTLRTLESMGIDCSGFTQPRRTIILSPLPFAFHQLRLNGITAGECGRVDGLEQLVVASFARHPVEMVGRTFQLSVDWIDDFGQPSADELTAEFVAQLTAIKHKMAAAGRILEVWTAQGLRCTQMDDI